MKILDTNYTCQVISLPPKIRVVGLDNLVEANETAMNDAGKSNLEDEQQL